MSETLAQTGKLTEALFQAQHQALFCAIFNNISEGIFIADAAGQFLYFNPFARKVAAMPQGDGGPIQWSEHFGLFRPDERTPFPEEELPLRRAVRGEDARDINLFVRNATVPQGVHIRVSGVPIRDEQGNLLGAMALMQDLDSLRRIEAEKRRTEQRYRLLVETAQEGIWAFDTEGRTTYVNHYLTRLLGYSAGEMMGKHLRSFSDEELPLPPNMEARDFRLVRKDGEPVWTRLSTSPISDEGGRYLGELILVTDVTERRRAEEQLRRLNDDLEHLVSERTAQLEFSNRELEAFAYSVAHDLRTPLRSISSFGEALAEDCSASLNPMGLEYLRRIRCCTRRMAELIDGILALSRVNRTELVRRRCDLSAVARSIADQLQATWPERGVRFTLQEGLVDQGDPQLLRAVLENLLDNAWKFTRERPLAEIDFGALQGPEGVRIYYVRDNGAGFDMAYRDKLFGVFQRLHSQREFEGTGVGLATVQRIVHRHGGRIWGEGQPGAGARFFFTLNERPLPPGAGPLSREK